MRLPWVGREALNIAQRDVLVLESANAQLFAHLNAANERYDRLFAAYAALRVSGANAPEPEKVIPPPKRPPAIVYRAMRAISPRDDATFAANWRLWEENQDECDKDPAAFAERIKRGRMTPGQPRAD